MLAELQQAKGSSELEGGLTDQILQLWEQLTVSLVDCGVMPQQWRRFSRNWKGQLRSLMQPPMLRVQTSFNRHRQPGMSQASLQYLLLIVLGPAQLLEDMGRFDHSPDADQKQQL